MSVETYSSLFVRDLSKAADEVEKYTSDESLWTLAEGIGNSGGTLAMHLSGNINHFIGAILGNTGYVRDRDREFSDKGISREEAGARLRGAAEVAEEVFGSMNDADLAAEYPEVFLGETRTTDWVLAHLLTHLNYHLGQINYHRRLVG